MRNQNFWQITFTVCTSIRRFPSILRMPLWKPVYHYILLALCCCLGVVLCRTIPIRKSVLKGVDRFARQFGEVDFSDQGIRPSRSPEKSRKLLIGKFRIEYFSDRQAAAKFDPEEDKFLPGIIWLPDSIFIWRQYDKKQYSVIPFPLYLLLHPAKKPYSPLPKVVKQNGIIKYADSCLIKPEDYPSAVSLKPNDYILTIFVAMLTFKFLEMAFLVGLVGPAYIAIFATILFILGRGAPGQFQFPTMLKLSIYTAFPALIIASLVTALNLPALEFQLLFSFAFLIYLFIVYNYLRKLLDNPPPGDIV